MKLFEVTSSNSDRAKINDEEWHPIPGYEGFYEVTKSGRVRSLDRWVLSKNLSTKKIKGREMKPRISNHGYLRVGLSKHGHVKDFFVHKIVAMTFIGPRPEGMDICHYDGDRTNNHLENLRYDTRLGNMADQRRHGTHHKARRNNCARGHLLMEPNLVKHRQRDRQNRNCLACERTNLQYAELDEPERLAISNMQYVRIMAEKVDFIAERFGQLEKRIATLETENERLNREVGNESRRVAC